MDASVKRNPWRVRLPARLAPRTFCNSPARYRMRHCVFALITVLAGSAGVAQEGDPLKSADCRQALDGLQAQEAQAVGVPDRPAQGPGHREVLKQLEVVRRHAARACLGGTGDPAPPSSRFAQPLVTVPPVAKRPPAPAPALPVGPTVSLPTQRQPPSIVTACDLTGCWANDGSRLQRLGPNLVGPRGPCILQGVVLHCP